MADRPSPAGAPPRSPLLGGTRPDVSGGMGIYLTAAAVAGLMLAAVLFFALIFSRGAAAFWPKPLEEWTLDDGTVLLVQPVEEYDTGDVRARTGNREFMPGREDHVRIPASRIVSRRVPEDAVWIERREYGPFHGYLDEVAADGYHVRLPDGAPEVLAADQVLRVEPINRFGAFGRLGLWFRNVFRFLSEEPRESNTDGGVFPALIGTSLLVLLMSILVMPFGVLAAVYLNEYAKDTWFVRLVRISVNNLAGVPSIVFGVFGLGFFVYGLGDFVDHSLLGLPSNETRFGTGGLLWASLTMALLTVPVVVVATEEGLRAVPRERREGALALGATRWEALRHVILPGAKPGILTGLILAVARAAGEVAPLMLTGVVGLAPELPVDGEFPFLHLEKKVMHLGFHIYTVGFQSPNVEAVEPLVYATAALLLLLILVLNLTAIRMRARVRRRLEGR